ncbi:MAG: hypothetical protein AAGH15_02775, partial [Myxococcota bacterium]
MTAPQGAPGAAHLGGKRRLGPREERLLLPGLREGICPLGLEASRPGLVALSARRSGLRVAEARVRADQ